MKEEIRIKNKLEFDDFFKNSKGISNNFFVLYKKEKKLDNVRIGIAIGTKFGKAYKRNLYKRRLRNIIRNNYDKFNQNYDYVLLIRKSCDTIDYREMEDCFLNLIKKVK